MLFLHTEENVSKEFWRQPGAEIWQVELLLYDNVNQNCEKALLPNQRINYL